MRLSDSVRFLKGVGEKKAAFLAGYDIRTVEDFIINFRPLRFWDKRQTSRVENIKSGEECFLEGKLYEKIIKTKNKKEVLVATFYDETGYFECWWFNAIPYFLQFLKVGEKYFIYGKPTIQKHKLIFIHPDIENEKEVKTGQLEPIYSSGEILQKIFNSSRRKAHEFFSNLLNSIDDFEEFLPDWVLQKYDLIDRESALKHLHIPPSPEDHEKAIKRLKVEETLLFILKARLLKHHIKSKYKGIKIEHAGNLIHEFYHKRLDFELTSAQKRVMHEIRRDLKSGLPMNRLLQGDVGSGKTIVALMTSLIMCANGYQVCLMAPTEILATQHWNTFVKYLFGIPVVVELLTSSTPQKERNKILDGLKYGTIHILIGTHALIEEDVKFKNLGLVIIDEQHKFGVIQRKKLIEKREGEVIPHVLLMTATPIPRTLALTIYGDMDVSRIDEMPPNRKKPVTKHFYDYEREKVISTIKEAINSGEQCYWVFPLIEQSEKLSYENIEVGFQRLSSYFGNTIKLDILHGRMPYEEKRKKIEAFKRNEIQILVSTPVIEVGIDVPSVNYMVIESAEKFGLAQLHQLRGRVGRGGQQGFVFLITSSALTEKAKQRIKIILTHTDGFKIAEEDIRLRGPGDILGEAQSGEVKYLRLTNLSSDIEIVMLADKIAEDILNASDNLTNPEFYRIKSKLKEKLSVEESALILIS